MIKERCTHPFLSYFDNETMHSCRLPICELLHDSRDSIVQLTNYYQTPGNNYNGVKECLDLLKVSIKCSPIPERYIIRRIQNYNVIPWVAILDPALTSRTDREFFVLYSLKADGSGIYLSINHGVRAIQRDYGDRTRYILLEKAAEIIKRNSTIFQDFRTGPIEYNTDEKNSALPQYGTICSKLYETGHIAEDNVLMDDLASIIGIYDVLVKQRQCL